MLIVQNIENNAIYTVQKLYLLTLSFLAWVILASFTSSIVSVHSSINGATNYFLHLQFSWSKYSPTSHALSHSHSQLLGFQINPLLHTPLLINSLHSHLHLFLLQRCLLLQILAPNLNSHSHVSCHYINVVSLVLDIRLNTLTFTFFAISGTQIFAYG